MFGLLSALLGGVMSAELEERRALRALEAEVELEQRYERHWTRVAGCVRLAAVKRNALVNGELGPDDLREFALYNELALNNRFAIEKLQREMRELESAIESRKAEERQRSFEAEAQKEKAQAELVGAPAGKLSEARIAQSMIEVQSLLRSVGFDVRRLFAYRESVTDFATDIVGALSNQHVLELAAELTRRVRP